MLARLTAKGKKVANGGRIITEIGESDVYGCRNKNFRLITKNFMKIVSDKASKSIEGTGKSQMK